MKCVKKGAVIKRVSDKDAANLVATSAWAYCPKQEYKARNKPCPEENGSTASK